jgi:hypothetical protein
MINLDPQHRPTSEALQEVFGYGQGCCYEGHVPFEAAERDTECRGMRSIEASCYCKRGTVRAYERCKDCLREAGYRV